LARNLWREVFREGKLILKRADPEPKITVLNDPYLHLADQIFISCFTGEIASAKISVVRPGFETDNEAKAPTFPKIEGTDEKQISIKVVPELIGGQNLVIAQNIIQRKGISAPDFVKEVKERLEERGLLAASAPGANCLKPWLQLRRSGTHFRTKLFGPGFNILFIFSGAEAIHEPPQKKKKRSRILFPA